jgi:hypothetical protein
MNLTEGNRYKSPKQTDTERQDSGYSGLCCTGDSVPDGFRGSSLIPRLLQAERFYTACRVYPLIFRKR